MRKVACFFHWHVWHYYHHDALRARRCRHCAYTEELRTLKIKTWEPVR
jgi:hypothetical protein